MNGVRFKNPVVFAVLALLILPFFAGCNAPKGQLAAFNGHFERFDYEKSALFAEKKISKQANPRGEDLLWALQLGTVKRIQQDYTKSTDSFDKAEDMLKYFDEQSTIGDGIGTTLVNENIIPYRGEEYDGIMVNVYKALNFMVGKKFDLARVEFNRALDRQRRAKEKFNEEINKLKSEMEKEQQQNEFSKSNVDNPETAELLAQKYPNLRNFEAYPDFVNPFATYLAGIFFNLVSDHGKAVDLLKESYGMVGDNGYIAEDLAVTENILDGKGRLEDTIWLIFENGLGPAKKEIRMDIPLFVATDDVKYVGIALPELYFRNKAHQYLTAEVDGKDYQTRLISDMDRVVQTEFSKDYPGILTRAIISATAKAIAQYALEKQDSSKSSLASVLMAAYSFATTAADVRIWTSLPKEFQVARFPKPKDGKLKVKRPGSIPVEINIPDCNNAIVYVRITTCQAEPIFEVINF
ncbi:MAG: hypothetical protein H8D56_22885 [Planctomycetes bacterium]|nr:hypothetical protein [Planctomycetota bacterium]MBL7146585.1 hypothetical protein [Phycisphaerae bacterium]